MTRDEALAEARKRWGPRASITEPGENGHKMFHLWKPVTALAQEHAGSGDSWESAFADADRRATT